MKIYIPKHLREIGLINTFCKMLDYYYDPDNGYYTEPTESTDGFRDTIMRDPVKYFLTLPECLDQEAIEESGQSYESVVNYLAKLFYSVKGTCKVFDYMKEYLKVEIVGDIQYNMRDIYITFNYLTVTDEEKFYTGLRKFFDALLVYETLYTNIGTIKLSIKDKILKYTKADVIPYKEYNL